MELAAVELLVLLVVGLAGWVWRLESHQAKLRWTVTTALTVFCSLIWIAAHPTNDDEPAVELICGGALGLFVMMVSRLRRSSH